MKLVVPDLGRGSVCVTFHDPGLIIAVPERKERLAQLLDGIEPTQPEQVLLQSSDEALGAAVPFRGADEHRRTLDPEDRQLLLKGPGDVLAAVIVPNRQAVRGPGGERPEALAHPLPKRLEGLEAGGPPGRAAWRPTHSVEQ